VCTPTGPIRLGFEASDEGYDSDLEAGVDAVNILFYSYAPMILTDSLPDEYIGVPYSQQLEAAGCEYPLIWTDKNNDLDGTGLFLSSEGLLSGTPLDTGSISFIALVEDAEGIPSEKQYTFHIWLPFICGDATMDYQHNIGDAVFIINYVFKGGEAPFPLCVGDANGDDDINVGDAVYLINFIFNAGPAPVEDCCP
jgi:hypothetical protein